MRSDRFLTLVLDSLPKFRRRAIPVLMYHSVSDEPEKGHPHYWINVSPSLLSAQMQFLHDHSYQVIDLRDAAGLYRQPVEGKLTNPVVLTFDDGYLDFYTHAFPILKKYGFSATVFLPTSLIDQKSGLRSKPHLGWDEVRNLLNEGVTFGSHTVTHPRLETLENVRLEYELRQSKETIEQKTGKICDLFCYPFSFPGRNKSFISRLRISLEEFGYRSCATTNIGLASFQDNLYFVPRLPVNSGDDLRLYGAKLSGSYSWVSKPQDLYKALRMASRSDWRTNPKQQ